MHTSSSTAAAVLVRDSIAAVAAGDLDAALRAMTDDIVIHHAGAQVARGKDTWLAGTRSLLAAFADVRFEIVECFATDDRVALTNTMTGRHVGDFYGMPATGRTVRVDSIELYRLEAGLVAEEWIASDTAGLFAQLTSDGL